MGFSVARLLLVVTAFATIGAGGAKTVPNQELVRMHALMAPYDFYPAALPSGLIYVKWQPVQLTPMACGQNLAITFAGAGRDIQWSSSRDCNAGGHVACHSDGYPGYDFGLDATQIARINGRRIYFSAGNHGSNAWACVPLRVGGYADMAVVGVWENFMTPRAAMILVAYARAF